MGSNWTTESFINGFFRNTLGRKKVHGTYRILEGDHCRLLVRATTEYGTPSGNELVAIDLSDKNNRLCFWQHGYSRNFTYRMSRRIEDSVGTYQSLPELMLTGDEEGILNSGIVDVDLTRILIEIGDKPYLMHREVVGSDAQAVSMPALTSGVPVYSFANQVPARVGTIQEAADKVKDPVDERRLVGAWWAKAMEPGFVPPKFEQEHVKTLSVALNPIDFGFTMEECSIGSMSRNSGTIHGWVPRDNVIKAGGSQVQRWLDAIAKWNNAADAFLGRNPQIHKGLSVAASRYAYSSSEETSGEIVVTGTGVFITGIIHNQNNWDQNEALNHWYKLTVPANQINIKKVG